jgi:hypothetical protein
MATVRGHSWSLAGAAMLLLTACTASRTSNPSLTPRLDAHESINKRPIGHHATSLAPAQEHQYVSRLFTRNELTTYLPTGLPVTNVFQRFGRPLYSFPVDDMTTMLVYEIPPDVLPADAPGGNSELFLSGFSVYVGTNGVLKWCQNLRGVPKPDAEKDGPLRFRITLPTFNDARAPGSRFSIIEETQLSSTTTKLNRTEAGTLLLLILKEYFFLADADQSQAFVSANCDLIRALGNDLPEINGLAAEGSDISRTGTINLGRLVDAIEPYWLGRKALPR